MMVQDGVLKGALIGCGYFANNHLNGWRDVSGGKIVALCDRDVIRARNAAVLFGIEKVYTDAGKMLSHERLDFVDVVT